MTAIIEEGRYILADVETNNNKFWITRLYDNGDVVTEWGRVGYTGQSKRFPGKGQSFMRSKINEKEGKGYRRQQVVNGVKGAGPVPVSNYELEQIARTQIATQNPLVEQLIARFARANVHHILQATTLQYDTSRGTFSTPLGIVDQSAINCARDILTRIGNYVVADDYENRAFSHDVSDYLMLVPQNIGMGRLNLRIRFPDLESVTKQNDILDSLEASLQMVLKAADDDADTEPVETPRLFEVRVDLVEAGREIDRIRRYYRSTNQSMHACAHLDVKTVYEIELAEMHTAFEQHGRPVGNIMQLWHGTKTANLLSILKSGLKCAPPSTATIAGKMFGNGIYFSDQSTKSLNYAFGFWDGKREENCFMFLADVAMGKAFTPSGPSSALPLQGYDSTFARAGKSSVANNEMIVYKNHQVDLVRLIEFSPNGK